MLRLQTTQTFSIFLIPSTIAVSSPVSSPVPTAEHPSEVLPPYIIPVVVVTVVLVVVLLVVPTLCLAKHKIGKSEHQLVNSTESMSKPTQYTLDHFTLHLKHDFCYDHYVC